MFLYVIIILGDKMKNSGNNYDLGGLIVVTILGIVGLGMIIASYFIRDNLYDMIYYDGLIIIFGGFFIGITLYCYYLCFFNVLLKPKEDVVYLKSNDSTFYEFLDKKGKIYYLEMTEHYKENQFYDVLKTKDNIKKIIGLSYKTFEIREAKRSYWLNFYSPIGSFENIMLLPIVYVIALPGILSVIMSNGLDKIYGIIFAAYPVYLIIYDFIRKRNRL